MLAWNSGLKEFFLFVQVSRTLHAPLNHQVGYLTEQVGSVLHQQVSLSSSMSPGEPQSSGPTPHIISSASAAASTTSLSPLVTPVTYISPPTGEPTVFKNMCLMSAAPKLNLVSCVFRPQAQKPGGLLFITSQRLSGGDDSGSGSH